MKWNDENRGSDLLSRLLRCGHYADVVREGAEPKTKREGSAKPYLMVQFHPAPPHR
jgi:hypothetical protein